MRHFITIDTRFRYWHYSACSDLGGAGMRIQEYGTKDEAVLTKAEVCIRRLMRRFMSAFVLAAVLSSSLVAQAPQPSAQDTKHQQENSQPKCTYHGTYRNSKGEEVPGPKNCSSAPQGASAQCRDGSYSFSRSHRGTCSHHGGVAKWL
jgi:hypothetical protein